MNSKENSGILPLVGLILLILGVVVGIATMVSQFSGSEDSSGTPQNDLPLLGSSFIWYGIAIVLAFLGILLVFFGRG